MTFGPVLGWFFHDFPHCEVSYWASEEAIAAWKAWTKRLLFFPFSKASKKQCLYNGSYFGNTFGVALESGCFPVFASFIWSLQDLLLQMGWVGWVGGWEGLITSCCACTQKWCYAKDSFLLLADLDDATLWTERKSERNRNVEIHMSWSAGKISQWQFVWQTWNSL